MKNSKDFKLLDVIGVATVRKWLNQKENASQRANGSRNVGVSTASRKANLKQVNENAIKAKCL